jgi:sortase B
MSAMAENNDKKKYSTGYGGNVFDSFPDFDSLEALPKKDVAKPTENAAQPDITKEIITEEAASKPNKKTKKSVFTLLCAVLIIAIISSSALAVFNISKSSSSLSSSTDDADFKNIYSDMVPKYNDVVYPAGIQQKLAKLYAQNDETVGWLYIPGTNINTPIVQHTDNDFYLTNNFYGSYTKYGCVFADYRCKKNTLSKNTVIYGHDMSCGTAFYDLNRYDDIEWYKKNPIIEYCTLNGNYTFLIYTAFLTTVNSKDDGGYVFNFIEPNMTDSNFEGFIEQVNQRALYTTDVDLNSSDKIINLSTCNYNYTNTIGQKVDTRLVVIGRLLRSGESADVNTSKAKSNSNYRRPQVWYDYKGKTNPYASSRSWTPSTK